MRRLVLAALLFISPLTMAADVSVEDYVAAELKMLETQIDQIHAAVNLMSNENLTDAEKFELIGKPSFSAVDNAMAESGFTLKQFLAYRQENAAEIEEWLTDHEQTAENIESLQTELDRLIEQYDQMMNVYHGE